MQAYISDCLSKRRLATIKFVAVISLCLLGLSNHVPSTVCDELNNDLAELDSDSAPHSLLDFYPFLTINFYKNETTQHDKLKASKSHFLLEITSSLLVSNSSSLATVAYTRTEDMIQCDDLRFTKEIQKIIECKTVDGHILDESLPEPEMSLSFDNHHVRRSLVKLNAKPPSLSDSSEFEIGEFLLYPLRSEVIEDQSQSILTEMELHELKFVHPNLKLGYYVEANIIAKTGWHLVCSGKVFLSVNRTRTSQDPNPELAHEIYHLVHPSKNDGFFFSMSDMNCHRQSATIYDAFSVNIDLSIIKRVKFPYLTVRNRVSAKPIKMLFWYEAKLDQVRAPGVTDPHNYNTTLNVIGASFLTSLDMNKVWVNTEEKSNWNEMLQFGLGVLNNFLVGDSSTSPSAREEL